MTKAQLEERISLLESQLSAERIKHSTKVAELNAELGAFKRSVEEEKYNAWKRDNAVYLKAFLKEVLPDILSISCSSDWGANIEIELFVDNCLVSSTSSTLMLGSNPLEE